MHTSAAIQSPKRARYLNRDTRRCESRTVLVSQTQRIEQLLEGRRGGRCRMWRVWQGSQEARCNLSGVYLRAVPQRCAGSTLQNVLCGWRSRVPMLNHPFVALLMVADTNPPKNMYADKS